MPSFVAFDAYGASYSPRKVPLRHTFAQEPGAPLLEGPWRGEPAKFGSSRYLVPESVPEKKRREYLFRKIYPLLSKFKKAGATEWHVSIDRAYHAQCNDGFTQAEMKMFLKLKSDIWFSAFEVSEEDETAMREKYERKKRRANKPLHGTPAKAPSSSTEPEGRRP